jgi:hypothetical protein
MVDDQYQIVEPTSQFFAARLITQEWAQPKDTEHLMYRAASDIKDAQGHVLVTAYALRRPDGQWSLMLINKDHDHAHKVRVLFHQADGTPDASFRGQLTMITFGKKQYQWHPERKKGHADPDGPPGTRMLNAEQGTDYELPAASLTVLRGSIGAP